MASSEIIISPGQHLTGITTTYTVAIFIPMAVIVMSLRLHARKAHGLSISADDKLCIVSLVVFTAYCAGALVCVCTYGAGQSYTGLEETELKSRQYLQARYADPLLHGLTLLLARFLLLLSCRRTFPIPDLRFRIDSFIILSATLWFFKTIPQVLICIPPRYFWDRSIGGGRSSSQLQFWTFGIFDLALDAVMLFLLVPRFILLQVGGLRVQLALAIFFGSIVIMTGTVRVAYGCITDDFLGMLR
ncbi:hypothetical protein BO86DRAFT_74401 [Aspergillus japonicus CBS 114.51]|uniref:Rhodopsin domain-containing protein n=1 Tax=Aspergillus japonicus CBS 114.51 TaxID=1448312 RepID=A0A8T8XG58_ASPJA|nr:hypothetical protein BO86DRAFT_74401 [Aspergillus japonicus CBS 114.51]RAH86928.1 hypothetical protein BO86DRAFT_74401 [Aspergillus japonicus CBS 114.51]